MLDAATNPYPADNMLAQLVKQQDPPIPYCDLFPQMSFPFQGKLAMECYTTELSMAHDGSRRLLCLRIGEYANNLGFKSVMYKDFGLDLSDAKEILDERPPRKKPSNRSSDDSYNEKDKESDKSQWPKLYKAKFHHGFPKGIELLSEPYKPKEVK